MAKGYILWGVKLGLWRIKMAKTKFSLIGPTLQGIVNKILVHCTWHFFRGGKIVCNVGPRSRISWTVQILNKKKEVWHKYMRKHSFMNTLSTSFTFQTKNVSEQKLKGLLRSQRLAKLWHQKHHPNDDGCKVPLK